jgi:hypothetical protein
MSISSRCMHFLRTSVVLLSAFALSGCLDDGSETPANSLAPDDALAPSTPPPTGELTDPPAAANRPPEIDGTPAASVKAGDEYSFVPIASDADDDFLEFSITNQPAWAKFSAETGTLIGVPDDAYVGETDDITIVVTDGRDTRAIGPFRIRINPRNQPPPSATNAAPTIQGTPATSVVVSEAYSFQPTASDVDGDRLTFSISNRPSWASFSSASGALSGTPSTANVATYLKIVITVSDGVAKASIGPFAIQVKGPTNRTPTISGTPATSVQATQAYSFTPSASDADSDALTYSIANKPAWATFSTSTGRLNGTPATTQVGNYANIVISASDGRASASLPAFAISVQAAANRAPTITGSPPTSVNAGVAYSFTPTAADADKDTLGFTIQNRPSWASFDTATGRLSGTPTSTNVGTYAGIIISVSDGRASASLASFSLRVNAGTSNSPPTISGTPSSSVNIGAAYSFQPSASDPEGSALTYSIQNRPSWASFSTSTGRLSGTPTSSNAGVHSNIVIAVTDGNTSVSLPAFSITVNQATTGSATLSWQPPTQNEDGTALTNLAGFRVNYGTSSSSLTQQVNLTNPGLSSYVISGLGSGTWYFAVKAYTTSGVESDLSNVASKTIP